MLKKCHGCGKKMKWDESVIHEKNGIVHCSDCHANRHKKAKQNPDRVQSAIPSIPRSNRAKFVVRFRRA